MSTGIEAIAAERKRQIEAEGWTPDHDDTHRDGEMLRAGVIYLHHGTDRAAPLREDGAPMGWPWDADWWKPKDRRRNLERAGALFQADMERRERAGLPTSPARQKLEIAIREIDALS